MCLPGVEVEDTALGIKQPFGSTYLYLGVNLNPTVTLSYMCLVIKYNSDNWIL